jgi:hypothetical protein
VTCDRNVIAPLSNDLVSTDVQVDTAGAEVHDHACTQWRGDSVIGVARIDIALHGVYRADVSI